MKNLNEIENLSQLKKEYGDKLPKHVGIILDGNRRWVRRKGIKETLKGHIAGYNTLKNILLPFFEAGVKYLSVYALSSENIQKRSEKEIKYLFNLMFDGIEEVLKESQIHEKKVNTKVIGRIHELSKEIREGIDKVVQKTKNYDQYFLNICINYDGQDELVDAVKKIIKSGIKIEDITKKVIKQNLYTSSEPELDYIIRTGMEDGARISGFLIWDSSYAEYRFRNDLWPDYNKQMLLEDLKIFIKRNRRKGS